MNTNPVRLAIIGSGSIANMHANAIARIPEAKLTAICSRNTKKAEELAQPSGARVTDSLEQLLAAGDIDAVLVATPSCAHAEAAISALRSKKHVLCEKPLEISSKRARLMIDEAERSGVLLAGFFPLRHGAGAKILQQAIETNRFGRLTFLSARIKWWREQSYYDSSTWRGTWNLDGGGALMNQGIHAVDLMQWLGGKVTEVSAFSATLAHRDIEVEDTLAATMRFENGSLGTIEATTSCYPGLDLSLEVSGDCGTAILVNDQIEYWRFSQDMIDDAAIRSGRIGGKIGGGASDPKAISCEGHRQQIVEFCRAIRGYPANVIDGNEAAKAVSVIEAIYRSAQSGRSEPILH